MQRARNIQLGLSLLLLAGALGLAISQAEAWQLLAVLNHMAKWPLLGVALIMFVGCLLAAVRFQYVAADLGYRLELRDAIGIYASGQLAGLLFFQLPGQLLARSGMLARRAVPVSSAIVMTGYERLCSTLVALVLAVVGAVYLFGRVQVDLDGNGMTFLKIVAGLTAACVGGALLGWGPAALDLKPLLARFDARLFLRTLALSLLIQLATMAAYVVLVMSIVDDVPVHTLAAASCLVMLAASVPISFAGWGMREMSAIAVLGAVGVSTQVSLVVAVTMGVVSLAALGLMLPMAWGAQEPAPATSGRPAVAGLPPIDYAAALSIMLPVAAATAVFFQVFVPVHSGMLNVNLADPIVILGGAFFVVLHLRRDWPAWRLPAFNGLMLAATGVLVLGYLHGLGAFGWSDWAFSNKLLGWCILLGYGATGALIVRHAGASGLDLLLRTFVGVAVALVALDVVIGLAYRLGLYELMPIFRVRMAGLSQNPNAFAFVLLLASAAVMTGRWPRSAGILGVLLFGIWCTGSRAAFATLPVMLAAAIYMRALPLRLVAQAPAVAVGLLFVINVTPALVAGIHGSIFGEMLTTASVQTVAVSPISDGQRWGTLVGAWQMFLAHPLLGAGLGAFIKEHGIVIHSVPLWILAEMGLVGLIVMGAPILAVLRAEARRPSSDKAGVLLVLIIAAFAVFGLAHDIVYQRAFWLILGAAAACRPPQGASEASSSR